MNLLYSNLSQSTVVSILLVCEFYLVIELSDVLLNVRQQTSEGELLNELSDVVVVIQGQTCPVAPCSPSNTLRISCTFLQVSVNSAEGVEASQAVQIIQLERMAFHTVGESVWKKTCRTENSIKTEFQFIEW